MTIKTEQNSSGQQVSILPSPYIFYISIFSLKCVKFDNKNFVRSLQTQLASHGFPMAYSDRRGSEYGASLGSSGVSGRHLGVPVSAHDHDPLALHQALQNAVDDQEQNQVCDESGTTFMTDLPLLKSE